MEIEHSCLPPAIPQTNLFSHGTSRGRDGRTIFPAIDKDRLNITARIPGLLLHGRPPVPRVSFTPHLQQHLDCPAVELNGGTVREVLEGVFASNPRLRGYVLDDRGRLRKHVIVFVDQAAVQDREQLTDRVAANQEVFVMQALSGG